MAIVRCTACEKKLKVADTSLGKKVKCTCGHIFVAATEAAAEVTSIVAAAVAEKLIVACTECGSKLKVAASSLGKKMKCPKCAAVFVANKPPAEEPSAAPVAVAPDQEDDWMSFAQAESKEDEPKSRKGKAPPPMMEADDDEPAPKATGRPEPKRPVPVPPETPKKYPSRLLVNLFVFFLLFVFFAAFAGAFFFLDEPSFIEPNITNRKFLEGFGWPKKTPAANGHGPEIHLHH